VLRRIRTELNRNAPARLDMEDVFSAVRDVISKEALLEAGEISISKRRKRRKKAAKADDGIDAASVVESELKLDETAATSDSVCADATA
jgi:hypothetical protein